jgi:hypothetical protein
MTTEAMTRYAARQPFDPFEFVTVDGRKVTVSHSDYVVLESFAASLSIYSDSDQSEVFNTALVVSIRTLHPIDD